MWIGVLGPIAVVKGGHHVVIEGMRQTAALAALVLYVGRSVDADHLVEALWPGEQPSSARRTLQSHLSRLRGALGADVIVRDVGGYRLSAAVRTDVIEYEHHLGRAAAVENAADAVAHLDAALAIWRDDPYPELVDWAPAAAERARLSELNESLVEDRLELLLGLGDPAGLPAEAAALVAVQPLRERRWGLLMRALYQSGRQAEALATFQEAREHLIEAVGVEPGSELRALERAVLEQDPRLLGPVAPMAASTSAVAAGVEQLPRFLDLLRARDPLVGRDRELDRGLEHWDRARRADRHATLVLRGEPGIGKTRLAAELLARAAASGDAVHVARCRDTAGAPYAPLAEAFPDLAAEVGVVSGVVATEATSPEQVEMTRRRVAAAFDRALERSAGGSPVVLLLDDVQWADAPTVEALGWLLERGSTGPMLLVLTVRSAEITEAPDAVAAFLADLSRVADTLELELTGVDRPAAGRIVDHRIGSDTPAVDVDWLFAQSGGSPLYLIELARHAQPLGATSTAVPRTIGDLVRRRLSLLPSRVRDLVVAGAVLGEEFEIRVVAAMLGRPVEEALDDVAVAVDAQLLDRQAATAYRFSHGITRRAVESTSSTSRLLTLRWAAGEVMEGSPLARPEEVADLLLAGAPVGDATRAARAALAAVSSARDWLDPGKGRRLLNRAVDCLTGASTGTGIDGRRVLAEVYLALAVIAARQGEVAQAKELAARAADLVRGLGEPPLFARTAVGYAELVNAGEADDVAPALCHEALTLLGDDHPDSQARVLAALANYHSVVLTDIESGRPYADRALVVASDDETRAEALWAVACSLLGTPDVAARARVAAELRACAPPGSRRHVEAVRLAAHTHLELGDRVAYDRSVAELRRLGEDQGSWDALLWAHVAGGQAELMEGRVDGSLAAAGALAALSGGSVYAWSLTTTQDCYRRFEQGELGSLQTLLESLVPQIDLAGVNAMHVQSLLQAGEAGRAGDVLDRIGHHAFGGLRQEQTYVASLAMLMEAALDLQRLDDVAVLAERLAPYSGYLAVSTQGVFSLGAVDRYLALAALAAGDHVAAEALLASARRLEAVAGATLGAAYTEIAEQWLRVARGEAPDEQVIGALRVRADADALVRLRASIDAVAARSTTCRGGPGLCARALAVGGGRAEGAAG